MITSARTGAAAIAPCGVISQRSEPGVTGVLRGEGRRCSVISVGPRDGRAAVGGTGGCDDDTGRSGEMRRGRAAHTAPLATSPASDPPSEGVDWGGHRARPGMQHGCDTEPRASHRATAAPERFPSLLLARSRHGRVPSSSVSRNANLRGEPAPTGVSSRSMRETSAAGRACARPRSAVRRCPRAPSRRGVPASR